MPQIITRGPSDYCHSLPVEVVGFLRKQKFKDGDWVFMVTGDKNSLLASQLLIRGPGPLNITVGQVTWRNNEADMKLLKQASEEHTMPQIKEANGLPPVSWNQAAMFM